MSVRVHSVPGQTKGRRKVFLEQACIALSTKPSVNVSYYKIVDHPIPILPLGIGNTQTILRTIQ